MDAADVPRWGRWPIVLGRAVDLRGTRRPRPTRLETQGRFVLEEAVEPLPPDEVLPEGTRRVGSRDRTSVLIVYYTNQAGEQVRVEQRMSTYWANEHAAQVNYYKRTDGAKAFVAREGHGAHANVRLVVLPSQRTREAQSLNETQTDTAAEPQEASA